MPEPVRGDQRYLPGLDGVRALAVIVVVAYHLQFGWAQGGLLGVAIFFTLSGYLITDILLGQWDKRGSLRLADFWLGRARRLLPALIVMLIVVAIWMTVANSAQLPGLRGNVIAAALYISNWWYIGEHASYYARFAPPAPLDHLWSLAVEEQFYLIWPWLLLLGLFLVCRKRGAAGGAPAGQGTPYLSNRARSTLATATLVIAAVSAWAMVAFYQPGLDPTRVYEGTDTRAFGLLIGAALAMVWPTRRIRPPAAASGVLDVAGVGALIAIALMVWRTNQYSAFLFRGGLVLLSAATALVVAAVATPGSLLGRALGWLPLRWLGVRSYGIYLWHYPLIVLTTASPLSGGMSPVRAVAVAAGTVIVAAASWKFVEEPIRRGKALSRLPVWAQSRRFMPVLAGGGLSLAVVVSVGASLVPQPNPATSSSAGSALQAPPAPPAAGKAADAGAGAVGAGGTATSGGPAPGALRTSCRSVVHIGDSTSDGLVSASYLPNASQRITARYAQIGITRQYMEISGGTSIVETMGNGQINAYQIAKKLVSQGYRGCWVIALGTNDTADVAIGSAVGTVQRIKRMMSVIGNQPVLWVNDRSLLSSGPYAEQNMQLWNQALTQEASHYPNMRVYDWAAAVQNSWYINDGIHFTSHGYAERALLIADALARAFPAPAQTSAPDSRHRSAGRSPGAVGTGGPATAGVSASETPRTSCRSVVHIGDSTSDDLVSASWLPNASQRITARYAQIGITRQYMEAASNTSVVETKAGQVNAYQVAKKFASQGYQGCWVIALGTNDTADVAIGSPVGRVQRVQRIMSVIGNQPVLWVNDRSLLSSGPYSEQNMQLWNQALTQEASHYPNMRVYDWAAAAQNSWYINDGIHFTSHGCAERALLIADALARAFPVPAQISAPDSRHRSVASGH